MEKAGNLNKLLDRASAQSTLDEETRMQCLMLLREGTDAQAVRAIAVLGLAGETIPPLPTTVRSGLWPNLPKKEVELRVLSKLAERESSLRSFMVALLTYAGPPEKTREKLFREYAERQLGDGLLDRLAVAIGAITEEIIRHKASPVKARKRLLRIAAAALGKISKGMKKSRSADPGDSVAFFGTLGRLLTIPPKLEAQEASTVLGMFLDQAGEGDQNEKFERLQRVWAALGDPVQLLRPGWLFVKLKKAERAKRDEFANAVIAYACVADTAKQREFAKLLLSLTLPEEIAAEEWLSETRAHLALMESSKGDLGSFAQLAQTLREMVFHFPVNLAQLQDIRSGALNELNRLLRACDAEIRRLKREIEHLESEEYVRERAGEIIRDEVRRQSELVARFTGYAKEKRLGIVRRLRDALQEVRNNTSAINVSEVENAILDTITLLEEPR